MSIQKDLDELNAITQEIQRLSGILRDLRKQKNHVEERVIQFLKNQETHGVRYNDQAVLLENKNVRSKKKKSDKIDSITHALRKHNVQLSEHLLTDILEAQRGTPTRNDYLKVVRR